MNLRQRVSVCVAKQRLLQKREPQRAQVYLGGGVRLKPVNLQVTVKHCGPFASCRCCKQ